MRCRLREKSEASRGEDFTNTPNRFVISGRESSLPIFPLAVFGRITYSSLGGKATMARFMGFRGHRLNIATILLVVLPAYMCFGYNLAVAGGLLTMPSFIAQFPKMDTVNNSSKFNSNIQGMHIDHVLSRLILIQDVYQAPLSHYSPPEAC